MVVPNYPASSPALFEQGKEFLPVKTVMSWNFSDLGFAIK
jgi:hypothetical protein